MIKLSDKEIIKDAINSKWFNLSLLYLLVGVIVFISINANKGYIDIIHNAITNITFLVMFILPAFLILGNNLYKNIATNEHLILRLHSKKDFIYFQVKSIVIVSFILYIYLLLLILIITNITPHGPFEIINDYGYNTLNIYLVMLEIIKVYLFILLIQFINLFFINILKNKNTATIIIFSLLIFIFMSSRYLTDNMLINIFLPGIHIYGYNYFNNIFVNAIYSLIYFVPLYFIFIYLTIKQIDKKDIIWGKRQ